MIPGRKAWQPAPVFLPGESHGQRSLAGYSPRGRKESDTTERQTLSLRFKFAGSKFGSLETGEGGDLLRTSKQRVKFAKFRAVESQRMERNGSGFWLILGQRIHFLGCLCGLSTQPHCAFLIPIFKFCSSERHGARDGTNWAVTAGLSRLRPGGRGEGGVCWLWANCQASDHAMQTRRIQLCADRVSRR